MKLRQRGTFYTITLTRKRLTLMGLHVFPLDSIRLDRIVGVRQAERKEYRQLKAFRQLLVWKYRAWPIPLHARFKAYQSTFGIEARNGGQIFLYLTQGMHYQLRTRLAGTRPLKEMPTLADLKRSGNQE